MRDNSKVSGHSLSERATRRSITYRNFLSIEPGSFLCLSVCLSVRPSVQGSVCTGIMIAPGLGHLWILHALTGSGYIWLLLRIKNTAREREDKGITLLTGGAARGGVVVVFEGFLLVSCEYIYVLWACVLWANVVESLVHVSNTNHCYRRTRGRHICLIRKRTKLHRRNFAIKLHDFCSVGCNNPNIPQVKQQDWCCKRIST